MHDTLKTNCKRYVKKKEKKKRKIPTKNVLQGFEPTSTKIDDSWFKYILKNGRAPYCAIESPENFR